MLTSHLKTITLFPKSYSRCLPDMLTNMFQDSFGTYHQYRLKKVLCYLCLHHWDLMPLDRSHSSQCSSLAVQAVHKKWNDNIRKLFKELNNVDEYLTRKVSYEHVESASRTPSSLHFMLSSIAYYWLSMTSEPSLRLGENSYSYWLDSNSIPTFNNSENHDEEECYTHTHVCVYIYVYTYIHTYIYISNDTILHIHQTSYTVLYDFLLSLCIISIKPF